MEEKYKVIYLIVSADPDGSNIALLNLLDMIIPKGVLPLVVMSSEGGLCEMLKERKIKYIKMKYYYSVYPKLSNFRNIVLFLPILIRTLLYNKIAGIQLAKIAEDYHADIIHTNIGPLHIGYKVARKLNIAHIWHIREYQDLHFGFHPLFTKKGFINKLRSENNFPIAITKGLFDHYSMKENARIIYDGVMKTFQTNFYSKKEKYFLFVGRLEKAKGIKELIAAFIDFARHEDEYKLLVAGDGADVFKSILYQMVARAGIGERIDFLGFRNDINDLMARATALVVPSKYEGFGFTTVEAMFNGCLVIGRNSGGTKEILEPEKVGVLYNNQAELLIALREVVSKGIERYFPIIHKAQEIARNKYSCEKNADEIYRLYQRLVNV